MLLKLLQHSNCGDFVGLAPSLTVLCSRVPKVWSVNSAGRTPSGWSRCRTGPAPPEGLGAPLFHMVASTVAVVNINPPLKPNGVVSIYRLFSNDTRGNEVVVSIVEIISVFPFEAVFSSFNSFVLANSYCWLQVFLLFCAPFVACSAMLSSGQSRPNTLTLLNVLFKEFTSSFKPFWLGNVL